MRKKRKILQLDSAEKTNYVDETAIVQPLISYDYAMRVHRNEVLKRYETLDFSKKKILNFDWVKIK